MHNKIITEKIKLLENSGYSKKAIDFFINKINVGIIENAEVALV